MTVMDEEEADMDARVLSDSSVDSNQFNLGFLLLLERIEIFIRSPNMPVPKSEHTMALEPFEMLFTPQ